jgi:hypothetical protein
LAIPIQSSLGLIVIELVQHERAMMDPSINELSHDREKSLNMKIPSPIRDVHIQSSRTFLRDSEDRFQHDRLELAAAGINCNQSVDNLWGAYVFHDHNASQGQACTVLCHCQNALAGDAVRGPQVAALIAHYGCVCAGGAWVPPGVVAPVVVAPGAMAAAAA